MRAPRPKFVDARMVLGPHAVSGKCAMLLALTEAIRKRGWKGRPLLAVRLPSGKYQAFHGSHRVRAAQIAGSEVRVRCVEYCAGVREAWNAWVLNEEVRYWSALDTIAEINGRWVERLTKQESRLGSGEYAINGKGCDCHYGAWRRGLSRRKI